MARSVLDTSYLIQWWRKKNSATRKVTERMIVKWANELQAMHETNAIVTPVVIEFIAGAQSRQESQHFEIYLDQFDIVDRGQITADDWKKARQFAKRIPRNGKPRQLGDCLISAIAQRLHHDVLTLDTDFPK